jgi:hypothetical protein
MNKNLMHCLESLSDSFGQISKSLSEMAFYLDQDDDESDYYEYDDNEYDDNESDEKEYVNLTIGKGWQLYNSAIKAICEGSKHEAILLSSPYDFDKNDTINNVLDYENYDIGVGGLNRVPVNFENDGNGNIILKEITIKNITGIIYGVVILNEAGLISYYELSNPAILQGGDFSIVPRV